MAEAGKSFNYPVAEVVGENQVACKRVGEGVIKIQDLQQLVPLDGV